MRLRYALISLFLGLTAVPLIVFWTWPYSLVLQNEFDDARNSHLLLARNIGVNLQRYHQDVDTAFNLLVNHLINERRIDQSRDLLLNLNFRQICIVEEITGRVIETASLDALACPEKIPDKRMRLFSRMARENRTVFSEVLAGPDRTRAHTSRRIARRPERRWQASCGRLDCSRSAGTCHRH